MEIIIRPQTSTNSYQKKEGQYLLFRVKNLFGRFLEKSSNYFVVIYDYI